MISRNAIRGYVIQLGYYGIAVLGSTVIIAAYLWLVCSDRYVSEAKIMVERDSSSSVPTLDLGIFSLGSGPSKLDAYLVKNFIESPAMLDYLEKTLKLREHYSDSDIDLLSRLWDSSSQERYFKYYLSHIDVEVDDDSMILDLSVEAFEPEYSRELSRAIVARSDQFINDVNQDLARDQMSFVKKELEAANLRLQAASRAVIDLQNRSQMVNAEAESAVVSQIIAGLQGQLATQRAELKTLLSYLSPAATEAQAARRKISALEQQIEQERSKQVGSSATHPLNDLIVEYKVAEQEMILAQDIYATGLRSLEAARLDTSRKMKHLVNVSAPTIPESATEPRRAYVLISAFVAFNVIYLLAVLMIATIRDHRE